MLSNPMLDVAIGLIFMYLLLSIIVTVLQEFIAATLKLRNKNLQRAIVELVGHENKRRFFAHPLIFPLFRGGLDENGTPEAGGPAYIPKRSFALTVLDLQGRGEAETDPVLQRPSPAFALASFFEDAESAVGLATRMTKFGATADEVIARIPNAAVKTAATDALSAAVGELKSSTDVVATAIQELERLFDSTMDRASGWYKVNAQRIAFGIGLFIAVLLNVDTIHVGRELWQNEDLRAAVVEAAGAYLGGAEGQGQLGAFCVAEAGGAPDAADNAGAELDAATWEKIRACTLRESRAALTALEEVGYPIGWAGYLQLQPGQTWPTGVIGFLLTALALSLGASFWFDLLGKFMKIRMTGTREATATA
ncbi:MAG: hypothetical protein R3C69_05070 [Geminicoccaceae bacterium]